jgi:hypothetical protein
MQGISEKWIGDLALIKLSGVSSYAPVILNDSPVVPNAGDPTLLLGYVHARHAA